MLLRAPPSRGARSCLAIGVISTTGARGLSPDPQPVTEIPSALSLCGGVAGPSPLEGGASATPVPTRGKAFPQHPDLNDLTSQRPATDKPNIAGPADLNGDSLFDQEMLGSAGFRLGGV
jgi:hypothetical protein